MSLDAVHSSLFLAVLVVAALHASLPTHWLSFVLVARAQGWTRRHMLKLVLVSGLGHVTTTGLVGLLAAALGKDLQSHLSHMDTPFPAVILLAFGLYCFVMGWRREGHRHCTHDHSSDPVRTDRLAAGALFLEMTLSPCETLIPIFFFAAGSLPWHTLVLMALLMSVITVLAMATLAFLAYAGYEKLTFPWLERNERAMLGLILMGLGGFGYIFR